MRSIRSQRSDDEAAPHVPTRLLLMRNNTRWHGGRWLQFIQILARDKAGNLAVEDATLSDFQPPGLSQVALPHRTT